MPTTPKGITYPDANGSTRLWEHFQTLADTTDDAIQAPFTDMFGPGPAPRIEYGQVTVNLVSNNVGTAPVTFAEAFAAAPTIVLTVVGSGSYYVPNIISPAAAGFTAGAARRDGSNATATVTVHWVAIGLGV